MSIISKSALCVIAAILAIGTLSPDRNAFAQAPSSVLPTGGGAALLDTSDTVLLLLDQQARSAKQCRTEYYI